MWSGGERNTSPVKHRLYRRDDRWRGLDETGGGEIVRRGPLDRMAEGEVVIECTGAAAGDYAAAPVIDRFLDQ